MNFRLRSHEILYKGKVFDLEIDRIVYDTGIEGVREVARHPGGAVTVPLFPDSTVMLVRQFRYPLQSYTLEVPAGKLNPGEDPEHAARRELEEETGWIAGKLGKLTSILTTPGFCNEVLHIYLATDLVESPRGHQREEGERDMTIERIPLDRAIAMIETQEIRDSKTIVGLLLAERSFNARGNQRL